MLIVQIVLICIAGAMVCAVVRVQRPEMATGISLAISAAIILILWQSYNEAGGIVQRIRALVDMDEALVGTVIKAAGISVVSELGVQICMDAGEKALAGRIGLASRVAMLSMCLPILEKMTEYLGSLPF